MQRTENSRRVQYSTISGNVSLYNHIKDSTEVSKQLKIELPCDPAISFLGKCTKEIKSLSQNKTKQKS